MKEFRQALDAHAAGRLDLGGVERELNLTLTRQPQLAAAHGALVEALYRSGRIGGETYLALTTAIRAFQKNQPRVDVKAAPPAPPPAQPEGADQKTQFRAPKPVAPTPAVAGADADKTQFRPPRAASTGSPVQPDAPAP